jgi:hypothetical protein
MTRRESDGERYTSDELHSKALSRSGLLVKRHCAREAAGSGSPISIDLVACGNAVVLRARRRCTTSRPSCRSNRAARRPCRNNQRQQSRLSCRRSPPATRGPRSPRPRRCPSPRRHSGVRRQPCRRARCFRPLQAGPRRLGSERRHSASLRAIRRRFRRRRPLRRRRQDRPRRCRPSRSRRRCRSDRRA